MIVAVIPQLVGKVYVTITVPNSKPVTVPLLIPILAVAGALLVHVPPTARSLSVVVVVPRQILLLPAIADGSRLTVRVAVDKQPVTNR